MVAKLDVEKAIRLLDERNDQTLESLAERGNDIVLKHLDKENITLNLDTEFLLHIEQFTSVKKNIYLNKSVKNFNTL